MGFINNLCSLLLIGYFSVATSLSWPQYAWVTIDISGQTTQYLQPLTDVNAFYPNTVTCTSPETSSDWAY